MTQNYEALMNEAIEATASKLPKRVWSTYQSNLFSFVATGKGNAVVQAVAGSGKSTTSVEAMKHVPAGLSTIFLAFNKSIAEELKSKGVNARTFHSLVFNPAIKARTGGRLETNKLRQLVKENWTDKDAELYAAFCYRMVGMARQVGIGCLVDDTEEQWSAIADHHGFEMDSEMGEYSIAIAKSRELLILCNKDTRLDFDDMMYRVVKDGISLPKFDFIFVDEAQDTNAIQRAVLKKIMKPNSRLVAVGDRRQSIYGFRGADSSAMDLIQEEFSAVELPLSITYRCAKNIVKEARGFSPEIEAAATAVDGEVIRKGFDFKLEEIGNKDMIVCRVTKPLIALCYSFIRNKIPAMVMGKEIGQGMVNLIDKMKARGIDALITKLDKFREREVEKARAKDQDNKIDAINDKVESIMVLIDSLEETTRTIPHLIGIINEMFADGNGKIVLATIHKAKGLEADTVFWLNSDKKLRARHPWQQQQEDNCCYIAITRAKTKLVYINTKD
jgi:DNA helicase-2/ATP-dependent DNA helicase PcrA